MEWNGTSWADGVEIRPPRSSLGTQGMNHTWTNVWVTSSRVGKYHRDRDCESLRFASPLLGELSSTRPNETACLLCWEGAPERSSWELVAHETERDGDSPYEAQFVRTVLSKVPGLQPHMVEPQVSVIGASGKQYRVDFMVHLTDGTRMAVELDGYNKTPDRDPSAIHAASARRKRDLEAVLGRVVAFTNDDLRSPHGAVRELEALVAAAPRRVSESVGPSAGPSLRAEAAASEPSTPRRAARWVWLAFLLVVVVIAASMWRHAAQEGVGPRSDGSCPASAPIKGNAESKIYHLPGSQFYDRTRAERCFESLQEAEADGYRASEAG